MKKLALYVGLLALLLASCGKETKNESGSSDQVENVEQLENVEADNYSGTKFVGVRSGIVKYKITSSQKIMGKKLTTEGTSTYVFKDYGAYEREEEVVKETYEDQVTTTDKDLTITKDGVSYDINMQMHEIWKSKDSRLQTMKQMGETDFQKGSEKFMTQMGAKKVGTERVKGYKCDIWEIPIDKTKIWMYKGIALKEEGRMGGLRVEEAVSIKFNTSVSDDYFELPEGNFRTVDAMENEDDLPTAEDMKKEMQEFEAMKNMTFEQWKKKMKAESGGSLQGISDAQLRKSYEAMKEVLNN